jgi:hypothetical protein
VADESMQHAVQSPGWYSPFLQPSNLKCYTHVILQSQHTAVGHVQMQQQLPPSAASNPTIPVCSKAAIDTPRYDPNH